MKEAIGAVIAAIATGGYLFLNQNKEHHKHYAYYSRYVGNLRRIAEHES